jgi:hypothetical protein
MRLAESVGLHDVVTQMVRLPGDVGANPAGKATTIVAGMAAGADSIEDVDLVRHGGMPTLFFRRPACRYERNASTSPVACAWHAP